MKTKFGKQFNKDIENIINPDILNAVYDKILNVELANNIKEIDIYKKAKGSKNHYMLRINDYCIGLYIQNNIVEFVRFIHRKDFYKYFPQK